MREPLGLKPHARKPAKKKKTGRPTKFDPTYVSEGERLATIGVSQNDMAFYWGVDPDTVVHWKKRFRSFSDAIKRGESKKKVGVLQALFKNAVEHRNVAAQIFLAKNWCGMTDRQDVAHSGDLRSILKFEFGSNGQDEGPADEGE